MIHTVRIGLVGCSWFALRAHIPALERLAGCTIVAVCSRTRKSMAKAEARLGREVRRHAKMEELFTDPDIDAVLLCLPIPLMPVAIEAALRAGKHVLSEKPAAPSLEACVHLMGVLRELGPAAPEWLVLENWCMAKPSVRWLRERIQERAIGAVRSAHCTHDHPADAASSGWRSSPTHAGGWLVDVGVHWARLLRILLGEPTLCSADHTAHEVIDPPTARGARGKMHRSHSSGVAAGPSAGSLQAWTRFQHCASAATISLTYGLPSSRPGKKQQQSTSRNAGGGVPPALRVVGERGCLSWWPSEGGGGAGGAEGAVDRLSGWRSSQHRTIEVQSTPSDTMTLPGR